MIYTTNAVEALNRSLRKIIKTRGSFPNDDAALGLLYLAIRNAGLRWRRGAEWTAAIGQFAIQFGARFPGVSAMPRTTRTHAKMDAQSMSISRQTRWHQYGRPAIPVKAGLRRLRALTEIAAPPLLATKRSTVGSG